MSSIIKVDTIQNQSGANIISESANTITVGASGDTVTIPSGGTLGGAGTFDLSSGSVTLNDTMKNTPAFKASKNNTQSLSDNTYTVVQYDDEDYDSDGCYDTSTYKFTPTSSGQYFFYAQIFMDWTGSQFLSWQFKITKNGSAIAEVELNSTDEYGQATISGLSDANGTTDYFQVEALINGGSGPQLYSNTAYKAFFLGYKLIGT